MMPGPSAEALGYGRGGCEIVPVDIAVKPAIIVRPQVVSPNNLFRK